MKPIDFIMWHLSRRKDRQRLDALPFELKPLTDRLAALAPDDPLHRLVKGFLHASMVSNANVRADGEAAHQLVGRQNMLSDLVADWDELWRAAHSLPTK